MVARAAAIADEPLIGLADLPSAISGQEPAAPAGTSAAVWAESGALGYREAMDLAQQEASATYLTALLARHGGNVAQAAEQAKMARESLHRLLRRHAIDPARFR